MDRRAGYASAEEYRSFLDKIREAEFDEAFDEHDRRAFDKFLIGSAMRLGGFTISISEGEQRTWYRYKLARHIKENGRNILVITVPIALQDTHRGEAIPEAWGPLPTFMQL